MAGSRYRNKERLFYKILVPIDGSNNAYKALEYAVQLAKRYDAKLTLLHVVEEPRYVIPEGESFAVPKRIVEYGEQVLSMGKDIAGRSGVKVQSELLRGNPAERILAYANKGNFDLIIMGTRGLSRIKSLLFGSVSDKVIHYGKCHVLLIRPDPKIEPGARWLF